jgi:protein CpxP
MSDQSSPSGKSGGGRTLTLLVVALVAALAGAAAAHFAGHRWHHGPFGHGFHHEEMSATDVQTHVDRMVEHFARHANATPDQQTKLAAIAKAAATDLLPLHQQFFEAHKKASELLRQPTIDRAAIETLRAEQIARADAASKRLAKALADAAEVLTPQQRMQLLDRFDHDDD